MTNSIPLQIPSRVSRFFLVLLLLAGLTVTPGTNVAASQATAAINDSVSSYLQWHPAGPVSLIVQTRADSSAVEAMVRQGGGRIEHQLSAIAGFMATVSPGMAQKLNHDPRILRLNLNAPIKWLGNVDSSQLLNRYESLSHVQSGWSSGLDGSEVKIAIIDTGVWPHNDLVQKSPFVPNNAGNRLLTLATNYHATDSVDHYGHGTHVAGIIGGNGYDSKGQYIGVAPNSLLVSVKVSDDLGNANEGDVITGLEWVYQANKHGMGIRIVNLSVTSTVPQSYHQSALDAEVEKLWQSGVVVVAAAGNSLSGGSVQYAPGNDPFAVTVGSIDDNYQTNLTQAQMASWALYGPTQDGVMKPDVVADGSHVVSLLAPGSQLSVEHPGNIQAPASPTYFKMGGTSMAAPQVAGMAAQMLQLSSSLTPGQVKSILKGTSVPFGTTAYTPRLGTRGGFADVRILGWFAGPDDNAGTPTSASYDPLTNSIQAGGSWWTGANWDGNVAWNNISWSNISWSSTDFSNISWSGAGTGSPVQNATSYWNSSAWSNISWSNISWSNISWSNISWSNISWSNISWSNISWSNISWSNISWSDTTWN